MTVRKDTKNTKPEKPYPEFPLHARSNGQWAKKIRGKVYCFGVWNDWQAALDRYESEIHDIMRGRNRSSGLPDDEVTLQQGINRFLTDEKARRDAGDISDGHFSDLETTLKVVATSIDKSLPISKLDPSDFRKLKRRFGTKLDGTPTSPSTLKGHVRRTKLLFNSLFKDGHIDRLPVYGREFGALSKKQQAQIENAADEKGFDRDEIVKLLNTCDGHSYRLRAMILLGINGGMGPTDIAQMTFDEIDLDEGWYIGERSKTGVRRCFKLWPQTIAALQEVIAKRFEPADPANADLVFITKAKRPFLNKGAISRIFGKLKIKAGVNGTNRGFYSLRHTCRDVANQQPDLDAVRWIVGHKRNRQTAEDSYTRTAPRERITAVCDHVRQWLEGGSQ